MEEYHYVDWLKDGELVIVIGLITREEEGMLLDPINAFYEKNVAGVVINLSFYIREIPQTFVDRGNFWGLPIFEMPAMLRIVECCQMCWNLYRMQHIRSTYATKILICIGHFSVEILGNVLFARFYKRCSRQ